MGFFLKMDESLVVVESKARKIMGKADYLKYEIEAKIKLPDSWPESEKLTELFYSKFVVLLC